MLSLAARRAAVAAAARTTTTTFSSSSFLMKRHFASLPDHTVVGLPALSPTMTAGNLAQWLKKEGDEIGPGDALCDIETDKATMAFEAQDEAFLAKILVKEGTTDISVGSPIMVLVENKEDVAAFKDFTLSHVPPPPTVPTAEAKKAEPATPPSPPTPAPVKATPPPPPPAPVAAPAAPAPPTAPSPPPPPPPSSPSSLPADAYAFKRWGTFATGGALARSLSKAQKAYVEKYGSTLQKPL